MYVNVCVCARCFVPTNASQQEVNDINANCGQTEAPVEVNFWTTTTGIVVICILVLLLVLLLCAIVYIAMNHDNPKSKVGNFFGHHEIKDLNSKERIGVC